MKLLISPFEYLYHLGARFKNYLYDSRLLKRVKLDIPVVSVGNLTFGGAGKTPHVTAIAEELQKIKKTAVVCRSYRASLQQAAKVDLSKADAARVYGDEAVMLKQNLSHCDVWSGPDKTEAAIEAVKNGTELILLDDGFSHYRLSRNFDIVLIELAGGFKSYRRECTCTLSRADAVIITKTQHADKAAIDKLKKEIKAESSLKDENIFVSRNKLLLPKNIKKAFVVTSIALPESFIADLTAEGCESVQVRSFSDHHFFTESEELSILNEYLDLKKNIPEAAFVCTRKDFVKFKNSMIISVAAVADLKVEIDQKEVLIENIRKSF